MTTETETRPAVPPPALLEALSIGALPDVEWGHEDDLCDCTFQRVGMWKNPYLAETLEIRLCCVWAELAKTFPQFVRTIPGYFNDNTREWQTTPWDWDGQQEMPKALWYRQLARKQDRPLSDVRAEYSERDELRPKGRGDAMPLFVNINGNWVAINLASRRRAV